MKRSKQQRSASGLGLFLKERPDARGLVVVSLLEGGAAECSGQIEVGDRLLAVRPCVELTDCVAPYTNCSLAQGPTSVVAAHLLIRSSLSWAGMRHTG